MSHALNQKVIESVAELAAKFIRPGEPDSDVRFHAFVFALRGASMICAEQFARHGGSIQAVEQHGTGIAAEFRAGFPDVRHVPAKLPNALVELKPLPAVAVVPVIVAPVSPPAPVKVSEPAKVSPPASKPSAPAKKR